MKQDDPGDLARGRSLRELADGANARGEGWLLASDVEGPLFLGDFIAEALSSKLKPEGGGEDATPSYGQILYREAYHAFSGDTLGLRRPAGLREGAAPEGGYTLAQEGTDTIFALPLLLAAGADYAYLEGLALRSAATPGAEEMARGLARMGWTLAGITTAPQQPYREVAARCGWLQPTRVLGSPFPLIEAEACLRKHGLWEREMALAQRYLRDACQLIDRLSEVWMDGGTRRRHFSHAGKMLLRQRFQRFYREELGISYLPGERARGPAPTMLGRIVEACAMVGDRAKAALALSLARRAGGWERLVAMGDGANDAVMLRRARWSIGVNGPDAARAARIGLVTDDMRHALVLFRLIESGEDDVDAVIAKARAALGGAALVHRGGDGLAPEWEERHRQMKRRLRGEFVTY
ncbi:hypothetical protein [Chromobacterium sp. IIBBL 290-4]|uniref:hypothetical protein n=1 Tax=Chromobacterium sp. IIBBL 290-4 TaxID=2953890 RepID=UPI0020B75E9F|nr:hypothetical protein [Chromobacterium sp. IIBBL 290-4]UTH72891.1 hypothetical protein NKT35_15260 [Chromobacterium sp. IIBBL 290-4]